MLQAGTGASTLLIFTALLSPSSEHPPEVVQVICVPQEEPLGQIPLPQVPSYFAWPGYVDCGKLHAGVDPALLLVLLFDTHPCNGTVPITCMPAASAALMKSVNDATVLGLG